MSKEEKKLALSGVEGIVPQLRFPEFEKDGEWEIKKLSKLGHLINGLTYSPTDIRDEGLLVLRSSNVQDGKIVLDDNVFVRPDIKGANISKPNDILICVRNGSKALIGKNAILPENLPYSTHGAFMTMFRAKNPKFTFQLFQTEGYDRQVKADLGATINSINGKNFIKYEFAIPQNPAEQQKIAACLSSLDEVITAETEKLDLLQDHKKGLLQQLFPAEGESQPNYRFPEFKDDGDWEETVVDDDFEVCSSKRVLQQDWIQGGVPFYRTRELVSLSKNEPFGSEIFISESLFQKLSKKYGVPKAGDFLVSGVGTLGILYQVKENDKFYFKDGNVIWFKTGHNISSDYFKYCFQTQFVQNQIFSQSSASTVGTYTISNARKTKFWKPTSKEEQQKIADCLSAADELIEAQAQKVEALQEHKKGLLQQLFPNLNELAV